MMDLDELTALTKDIKIKVDLVYAAMLGDPTDDNKPGCRIKQDRLEQSLRSFKRHYFIVLPILLSALLTLLIKTFL